MFSTPETFHFTSTNFKITCYSDKIEIDLEIVIADFDCPALAHADVLRPRCRLMTEGTFALRDWDTADVVLV